MLECSAATALGLHNLFLKQDKMGCIVLSFVWIWAFVESQVMVTA